MPSGLLRLLSPGLRSATGDERYTFAPTRRPTHFRVPCAVRRFKRKLGARRSPRLHKWRLNMLVEVRDVDRALRPSRLLLRFGDAACIHRHLQTFGKHANAVGHHYMALVLFECAHAVREDVNSVIAANNMRIHLHEYDLAAAIYARLLAEPSWDLSETQHEMVERKQAEVAALLQNREASPLSHYVCCEDEVQQLLRDPPERTAMPDEEGDMLVRLIRRHGHAANEAGEIASARLFFDCAFAFSRAPADLLSAANMRAKNVEGSAAAEALYQLVSADESADEHECDVAERKLAHLMAQRAALAATAAAPTGVDVTDKDDDLHGERAWLVATVLCWPQTDADLNEKEANVVPA